MDKLKNILFYLYAVADKVKDFVAGIFRGNKEKRKTTEAVPKNRTPRGPKNWVARIKYICKEGTPAQKKELRSNVIFAAVVILMLVGITIVCVNRWNSEFSYVKELDETLFIYDGKEVELREITYYIMIEEESVNQVAGEYDPMNSNAYWNLHVNGEYVSEKAKEAALDYCVRDVIYAYKAKEVDLELSKSQIADLEQKAENIFEGLTEKQLELGLTQEDIYKALYNNLLADEYVLLMAKKDGVKMEEKVLSAYYGINSYFFKRTRAELDFVLNEVLWEEITLGNLTVD